MNITQAKIKFVSDKTEKLKAFCSITIDDEFVIRDIKIIEGNRGYFVAMPSRKLMDRCPACGGKNHLRAAYCNDCGGRLPAERVARDEAGRVKLHADTAHPINSECRERVQRQIIEAYEKELANSHLPEYVPAAYDDDPEVLEDVEGTGRGKPRPESFPASDGMPPPPPSVPLESDSFSGGIL